MLQCLVCNLCFATNAQQEKAQQEVAQTCGTDACICVSSKGNTLIVATGTASCSTFASASAAANIASMVALHRF
jgi:hypothetical protein